MFLRDVFKKRFKGVDVKYIGALAASHWLAAGTVLLLLALCWPAASAGQPRNWQHCTSCTKRTCGCPPVLLLPPQPCARRRFSPRARPLNPPPPPPPTPTPRAPQTRLT